MAIAPTQRRTDGRGHRPGTSERRAELFQEAAAIVESDLASDYSLREVAGRIATSPRQLQRGYEEAGGTTFSAHRMSLRMQRARQLMGGRATVREVAAAVGYREPSHFAKVFHKHFGVTPSAFRAGRTPLR